MHTLKQAFPVWHPFTQHALQPVMTPIASAKGAYLITREQRRILDVISSWWVVTHGHCHPRIVAAIQKQAAELNQIIFAGYTHEPAEHVAQKMLDLTGLDHCFFSDSGSTSVEVALKMALGYWRQIREPRSQILVLEHSYHGDTVGTMSVGERSVFNKTYEPLLFEVIRIPFPHPGKEEDTCVALEKACQKGAAAFLVEPLILGAGGMLMYSPQVLAQLHAICQAYGVLFIADEVMTGWGRTGTLFACEQAGITPDIGCYGKGLTGGALPLAVTLCHRKIFDAHYACDRQRMFFHSSSYTANPIACAAALENIRIWEDEPVYEQVTALVRHQNRFLERFHDHKYFRNVRQIGTITALDLRVPDSGYLAESALMLYDFFQNHNLLLRPLGNTLYVLPPYCVTEEDLHNVYEAIGAVPRACDLL